nr:hypothetical protein [Tanacetum cinerariifolium]
NVAKHRGFLAGETRSTQDLPAPKSAKLARKPQSTVTSTQPAPTSVSAKTQENKRKHATRTTDKPAKAKRIKRSISHKTRQSRGSPKSVGASEAEEVPAEEPQVADEDAEFQKAVEEGMKDVYALPKGPLPPVVIREPDAGPDPNAQAEGQTGSDTGAQAEGQAGSNPDETSERQAGSNPDETSEGQAGPDPGFTATVYPNVQENLKLVVEEPVLLEEPASSSGTLSSLQHLSRDFSFGDQFFSDKPSNADKSTETEVESMEHRQLKATTTDTTTTTTTTLPPPQAPQQSMTEAMMVKCIEEPASSSGTLSSLQHLSRDFSFGDQFFSDKPSNADKSTETEVESMSPKEHRQLKATTTDTTTTTTTTLPPPQAPQQSMTEAMMVKCIGELEHTLSDLIQVNKTIEERLDKHGARLYTLEQLDIPQQVSIAVSEVVTDAVDWAMKAPLRNRFKDLPEADMKEILHQRMWKPIHTNLMKTTCNYLKPLRMTPPPPPPTSTNQDSLSTGSAAPSLAKTAATTKHQALSTPDVTLKPLVSLTLEDLDIDEAMDKAGGNLLKKNDLPLRNLLGQFDHQMCPSHRITGHQLWRLTIHPLLKTRYSRRPVTLPPLWTGSASGEELLSLNLKTWKDRLMR